MSDTTDVVRANAPLAVPMGLPTRGRPWNVNVQNGDPESIARCQQLAKDFEDAQTALQQLWQNTTPFATLDDALNESQLRGRTQRAAQLFRASCLDMKSFQGVPSVDTDAASFIAVELPVTIGGEAMLSEPPLKMVLAGYGVLGGVMSLSAAIAASIPTTVGVAEGAAVFPEIIPTLQGLRLAFSF